MPFLELLQHSQRGAAYSTGDWALRWTGLGNFLVPLFQTVKDRDGIYYQSNQQWVTSYYAGIIVLGLAVLGLLTPRSGKPRFLAVLLLIALVLALGAQGFIYDGLKKAFPAMGVMRYPIKFIVPVTVILPLLAAYGARSVFRREVSLKLFATVFSALAWVVGVILFFDPLFPGQSEDVQVTWRSGVIRAIFLAVAAGAGILQLRATNSRVNHLLPVLLGITIFADLITANRPINPTANPALLTGTVSEIVPRPQLGQSRAMVSSGAHLNLDATLFSTSHEAIIVPRKALMLDANLLEHIPKLDGFFSLYLPAPLSVIGEISKWTNTQARVFDFLSVSHVSNPRQPWKWEKRSQWFPMLSLPTRELILGGTNALNWILSENFSPSDHVVLEQAVQGTSPPQDGPTGRVLSSKLGLRQIEAEVELARPSVVVLSQAYYPGWRAFVDNQSVPLLKANFAFQAVALTAGNHHLRIIYSPFIFRVGAVISALTLLGVGFWWFRYVRVPSELR